MKQHFVLIGQTKDISVLSEWNITSFYPSIYVISTHINRKIVAAKILLCFYDFIIILLIYTITLCVCVCVCTL